MTEARTRKRPYTPSAGQLIVFSFAAVIAIGTLLLMLPVSLAPGEKPDLLTAAFTATSCTCVTGLVVTESGLHFSLFGQCVLLVLIQIGGLGFMTLVMLLMVFVGKRITLSERMIIQEAVNGDSLSGMIPMLLYACRLTFLTEGCGAVLLAIRFVPRFGWGRGLYYSVFHAVSAFCNAGFDVLGLGDSVASLNADPLVMIVLMLLVVVGGIGFPVITDILRKRRFRKLTLHSRVVLQMTALLLLLGTVLTLALEADNPETLGPMAWPAKVLNAAFQSVTLRTAGFASFGQNGLRPVSKLLAAIFMFIGASPASTGGGIKTTTAAMTLLVVSSAVRGSESTNIRGRRLARATVARAVAIFVIALGVALLLTLGLSVLEMDRGAEFTLENLIYEACSALGTAGLTTGITPSLTGPAKVLLMGAMFIGRVGPLSLTLAFADRMNRKNKVRIEYPEDHIIVG